MGSVQQAGSFSRHPPADPDPALHRAVDAVLPAQGLLHGRLPGHGDGAAEPGGRRGGRAEADGREATGMGYKMVPWLRKYMLRAQMNLT